MRTIVVPDNHQPSSSFLETRPSLESICAHSSTSVESRAAGSERGSWVFLADCETEAPDRVPDERGRFLARPCGCDFPAF